MELTSLLSKITVKSIYQVNEDGEVTKTVKLPFLDINKVTSSSKKNVRGSAFVGVHGFKSDGNDYIAEAIAKGAEAIITDKIEKALQTVYPKGRKCVIIEVDDARRALAYLCDAINGYPSDRMHYIAVTGTNGKTSVTYMLKYVFEAAMFRCGLVGTVNCYSLGRKLAYSTNDPDASMTTPDPEPLYSMLGEMADDGVEYVFLEATSHALELGRLAPITFDAAIFTNLTPEHLDFHKTMENYLEAKLKLFDRCGLAILNADDKYYPSVFSSVSQKCRICSCSVYNGIGDYQADNILFSGVDGCEYQLTSKHTIMRVKSPIPGRFTVMNTLQACALALELGIKPSYVYNGISRLCTVDGRMERIRLCPGADFSLFIDYAHTPDAMENLIETVHTFRKSTQRITVLFGCGGDRDKTKRAHMGSIVASLADKIIVTSDNPRTEDPHQIIADIMSGIPSNADCVTIPDRSKAIEYAIRTAKSGDIILLVGKGHEKYEITCDGKRPFDERNIAINAARKYHSFGSQ